MPPCASASGGLMVGIGDLILNALKDLQVHPIGALIVEAHQIVEHRHLISGQISQGHRCRLN